MNISAAEILIVLVIALLVLGPNKLPEAAKQLGKAVNEFKKMSNKLEDGIREAAHVKSEPPQTRSEPSPENPSEPPAAGN